MNLLLDTNVVSEIRKIRSGRADAGVEAWARRQSEMQLYVSVITIYEIERGVRLAERKDPDKARMLRTWLDLGVLIAFDGRILDIDSRIAMRAGALRVQHAGELPDALIAATALEARMTLVTRNAPHFEPLGVRVLNPWLS